MPIQMLQHFTSNRGLSPGKADGGQLPRPHPQPLSHKGRGGQALPEKDLPDAKS
ncbi:hypothetical protein [[Phormidium] sp. ETS-05]|uniref:hypothetical protein n=1 Tax=[Phormidium] sp. ETS-05 TaxID=222819 RepID=UPI0018EED8B0|nr:hypothetical protein [[Phormidium] sp. ETS-05]